MLTEKQVSIQLIVQHVGIVRHGLYEADMRSCIILAEYLHKIVSVMGPGRHSVVKNTEGWVDNSGSGILVRKKYLRFKNIDLDNS